MWLQAIQSLSAVPYHEARPNSGTLRWEGRRLVFEDA